MACLSCGFGWSNKIIKKFHVKQYLESIGFKYTGSCNCNGGHTDNYENGSVRVDIGTSAYWIKKRNPIQWSTVSYGNQSQLKNDLQKWL